MFISQYNFCFQLNTQNVTIAGDESNSDATSSTAASPIEAKEEEVNQQFVAAINPHLLNIVKMDQKQVECNLCHRKFKNIPALNGHMRLHGGYFKKDPETKKTEKKEASGPPLQTASIGVRALIEEKIISKRKDMNKVSRKVFCFFFLFLLFNNNVYVFAYDRVPS